MRLGAYVIALPVVAVLAVSIGAAPASASSVAAPRVAATGCDINDDHDDFTYCHHVANARMRALPNTSSKIVGYLPGTYSPVICWAHGEWHNGGNNIWYWVRLSEHGQHGYSAAVNFSTSVDPYPGIVEC